MNCTMVMVLPTTNSSSKNSGHDFPNSLWVHQGRKLEMEEKKERRISYIKALYLGGGRFSSTLRNERKNYFQKMRRIRKKKKKPFHDNFHHFLSRFHIHRVLPDFLKSTSKSFMVVVHGLGLLSHEIISETRTQY